MRDKRRRTFVTHDGSKLTSVIRMFVESDRQIRSNYFEIEDEAERILLSSAKISDIIWDAGRVKLKPEVHIAVKSGPVVTGEEAELEIVAPVEVEEVRILVGSIVQSVPTNTSFYIKSNLPQRVWVSLYDEQVRGRPNLIEVRPKR